MKKFSKLFALLVVGIMMLSMVPLALAEDDENFDGCVKVELDSITDSEMSGPDYLEDGDYDTSTFGYVAVESDMGYKEGYAGYDTCNTANYINEYYCEEGSNTNFETIHCEYGCISAEDTDYPAFAKCAEAPEDETEVVEVEEDVTEEEETEDVVEVETDEEVDEVEEVTSNGKKEGRFKALREKAIEAKEQRLEKIQERQEARADRLAQKANIHSLRAELAECIAAEEDCEEKRKEVRGAAHNHLLFAADKILEAIARLESKVEESDLDDESKEVLLARLAEQRTTIEDSLAELEELGEDAKPSEIKEVVKELRTAWKEVRPTMKWTIAMLSNSRIDNLLEKLETTADKLSVMIDDLAAEGYDTSDLESQLDDFEAKIAEAQESNDKAEEVYLAVEDMQDVSEAVKEAHEYQKEAKESIREAKKILRDLFHDIRDAKKELADTVSEDESDEEVDEEEEVDDVEEDVEDDETDEEEIEDEVEEEEETEEESDDEEETEEEELEE